jgi:hypothetical protein
MKGLHARQLLTAKFAVKAAALDSRPKQSAARLSQTPVEPTALGDPSRPLLRMSKSLDWRLRLSPRDGPHDQVPALSAGHIEMAQDRAPLVVLPNRTE